MRKLSKLDTFINCRSDRVDRYSIVHVIKKNLYMSRSFLPILLSLLFISFGSESQAQMAVSNFTFREGMQKIAAEHKILMVIMDVEEGNSIVNGFTSKAVSDTSASGLNKIAIVIRPVVGGADWDSLNKRYFESSPFGTLFFNPKGVLVHRYDAISEHGYAYLAEANDANMDIDLPTADEQLDSLKKIHFSNLGAVRKLFDTRTNSIESTDDLLEPFLENTPLDSFEKYSYYYLLAEFAPPLETRGDSILRSQKYSDSNAYKIPSPEWVTINRKVVKKTMNLAVINKDPDLAVRAAFFSSGMLANPTKFRKEKEQYKMMTEYFYKIRDTIKYLETAAIFLNNYYLPMSIDSLKQAYINRDKEREKREGSETIFVNGASKDNMAYYGEFDLIASVLNHHAWEFYMMTKDPVYLKMALSWAKRALEFNSNPYRMDTFAQLLYVTGDRKGGISAEKDALKEYKKQNLNSKIPKIEKVLDNMKNNRDIIVAE